MTEASTGDAAFPGRDDLPRARPQVIPAPPPPQGTVVAPTRRERIGRDLLLAAIPALLVGVLVRLWIDHTPLASMNSDEALVGLQAREVLHGTFRLMVAGNDYGSTTESYLLAPLLLVGSGTWPLRLLAGLLWFAVSLAVVRMVRPLAGPAPALIAGLLTFSFSGAVVVLSSRPYLGYPTGMLAEVIAVAAAGSAMAVARAARLAPIALLAGVAAGFAIWSHPMFGLMALIGLLPPTVRHWRRWGQWWLTVAVGGVIGVSPWLIYIWQKGRPQAAYANSESTYLERVLQYLADLLPRLLGTQTFDGTWVRPAPAALAVAAVLIVVAFGGLILLLVRRRPVAWPIVLVGFLGIPALALFPQTVYVNDARYVLPLLPAVVAGLVAWLGAGRRRATAPPPATGTNDAPAPLDPGSTDPAHTDPRRTDPMGADPTPAGTTSDDPVTAVASSPRRRSSRVLVAVLPTLWILLTCVPVTVQQAGWVWTDPNAGAQDVAALLTENGIRYVRGDYWTTYLVDYYADGALQVAPDFTMRLADEAAAVDAASLTEPYRVALVYETGDSPKLLLPASAYRTLRVGGYDVYLPTVPVAGG